MDIIGNKMYWSQKDSGGLQRANLDGTGIETIVPSLNGNSDVALGIQESIGATGFGQAPKPVLQFLFNRHSMV